MIPLKDNMPTRAFPIVTVVIIILNVAVFAYRIYLGSEYGVFFLKYGVIPHDLINSFADPFSFNLDLKPLSTLFTAMFVHSGYFHLGGNMLYLWIFGNNVEDSMGSARFIVYYFLVGVLATLAHVAVDPAARIPMVGASGAIAGVLGGYLLLYPKARVLTLIFIGIFIKTVTIPASVVLIFWIVLQVVNGMVSLGSRQGSGVAWFAHIGGFAAGLLLIKLFRRGDYKNGFQVQR